jgi:hypothetical protein
MIQESNSSQGSLLNSFLVVKYFKSEMPNNQTVHHEWLCYTAEKLRPVQ